MLFFETSDKNGDNIENIFKESVEYIHNNIKDGKYDLTVQIEKFDLIYKKKAIIKIFI